jgi:hypothetical protein
MGGEDPVGTGAEKGETFRGVVILVHRQPGGGAAAAPGAPFFMTRDPGIQYDDVLYAHGVAGTHDGGDIVRIEYVLEDDAEATLSFVEDAGNTFFSFGSHNQYYMIRLRRITKLQSYLKGL